MHDTQPVPSFVIMTKRKEREGEEEDLAVRPTQRKRSRPSRESAWDLRNHDAPKRGPAAVGARAATAGQAPGPPPAHRYSMRRSTEGPKRGEADSQAPPPAAVPAAAQRSSGGAAAAGRKRGTTAGAGTAGVAPPRASAPAAAGGAQGGRHAAGSRSRGAQTRQPQREAAETRRTRAGGAPAAPAAARSAQAGRSSGTPGAAAAAAAPTLLSRGRRPAKAAGAEAVRTGRSGRGSGRPGSPGDDISSGGSGNDRSSSSPDSDTSSSSSSSSSDSDTSSSPSTSTSSSDTDSPSSSSSGSDSGRSDEEGRKAEAKKVSRQAEPSGSVAPAAKAAGPPQGQTVLSPCTRAPPSLSLFLSFSCGTHGLVLRPACISPACSLLPPAGLWPGASDCVGLVLRGGV